MSVIEDVDVLPSAIRRLGVVFIDGLGLFLSADRGVRERVGHSSLMHGPRGQRAISSSWRRMRENCRRENGPLETRAVHPLSRTAMRWL
jgi:hypothetical protein